MTPPLADELLAPALLPFGESTMLPAEAYTSPDVLAWERRHFFAASWVCLGRVEAVFVTVTGIKGDQITGHIDSDVRGVAGYKAGDSYTLSERDIVDWVIIRPDGSEEGNVVGKFLEERNAKQHK